MINIMIKVAEGRLYLYVMQKQQAGKARSFYILFKNNGRAKPTPADYMKTKK